jgi:mRNA deadenylase 3'-5' endonuclease subunit Ccr4
MLQAVGCVLNSVARDFASCTRDRVTLCDKLLSMQKMQRRRTWWASLFFGASSQEADKDVLAAATHDLLQGDLPQGTLSGDGSAVDERFSTNAEEMQRAAGEMDQAEAEGELGQVDAGVVIEQAAPAEEPAEKRCAMLMVHTPCTMLPGFCGGCFVVACW